MFLRALNIPGSGLTAEQHRLNLVAQNITNVETTRTESGGPYRRKVPVYQEVTHRQEAPGERLSSGLIGVRGIQFRDHLERVAAFRERSYIKHEAADNGGVKIAMITEDPTPGKMVYDPGHPDADENGYVEMPNVEMISEMVTMMSAGRSYEANVQLLNAMKAMAMRALELGR